MRHRREEKGLSLRDLVRAADLSPSFVSRLERGLAQPRLNSLHRIARALDTSAQGLLSGTSPGATYSLVRAGDRALPIRDDRPRDRAGAARSLVEGRRALTALEFTEYTTDFGPQYEHPGEELMIVAVGRVEVELGDDTIRSSRVTRCATRARSRTAHEPCPARHRSSTSSPPARRAPDTVESVGRRPPGFRAGSRRW